jgi:hypothetical protein
MTILKTLLALVAALLVLGLAWLALFPPMASRIFMNQRRAVISIRKIGLAESDFAARNVGFGCSLKELAEMGSKDASGVSQVDGILVSGTKSGYRFDLRCTQLGDKRATEYTLTAVPVEPGKTGMYAFCSDQRAKVWYSENGMAADCLSTRNPIEKKYEW